MSSLSSSILTMRYIYGLSCKLHTCDVCHCLLQRYMLWALPYKMIVREKEVMTSHHTSLPKSKIMKIKIKIKIK